MGCVIEGCERPVGVFAWQLCRAHYEMKRRREFVPQDTCSVESCQNGAVHCGLCKAHYSRLKRYGDPLETKLRSITKPMAFIEKAVAHSGSACLLWPYGSFSSGYGYVNANGRMLRAHRVVCERVHGARPDTTETAHSCGVRACVNPHHLRWATPKENALDKIMHGTSGVGEDGPNARLTEANIAIIRRREMSQNKLAKLFGVTQSHISAIQLRKAWKHVP